MTAAAPVKPTKELSCDQLYDRLLVKYPQNRFAVFGEVRNAGGFHATRAADAIIVALWPSDGHRIIGVEIKAARYDFVRELKDPRKAEDMARFCDEWFVLANTGVVREEDNVPKAWGIMEPAGTGIRIVRQPGSRDGAPVLERGFIASLLKRSQQTSLRANEAKEIRENCQKEYDRTLASKLKTGEERAAALQARVDEFTAVLGIDLKSFEFNYMAPKDIAAAVRVVLNNRHNDPIKRLEQLGQTATRIAADIERELTEVRSEKNATL